MDKLMRAWLGQPELAAAKQSKQPTQISGSTNADYYIKPRRDGRFNVCSASGTVTTRSTKEAAEQWILNRALDPTAGTAVSNTTQLATPVRASKRTRTEGSNNVDGADPEAADGSQDTVKRKNKPGAGRPRIHNKRKEPEATTNPEDALLDYLASNPIAKRSKHGELSLQYAAELQKVRADHTELQIKYDKARALLAAELGYESNEPLRRSEIAELVGTGYDDLKGRTIRRHKESVMAEIRLQLSNTYATVLRGLYFIIGPISCVVLTLGCRSVMMCSNKSN
jgi:hypothetical protein